VALADKLKELDEEGDPAPAQGLALKLAEVDAEIAKDSEGEALWNTAKDVAAKFGQAGTNVFEGALQVLGLPGDLANALQSAYPMPQFSIGEAATPGRQSLIGTDTLKQGYENLGLPFEIRDEKGRGSLAGNIGREVGAAAVPAAGIIKLGKVVGKAPKLLRNLSEYAANNPIQFLTGEGVVATTVGAVRTALESADVGPGAQITGEVLASLLGSAGVSSAERVYSTGKRGLGLAESGASRARSKEAAARVMQGQTVDKKKALSELDSYLGNQMPGENLTTAQVTGDVGQIGLEKAFKLDDAGFRTDLESQISGTRSGLEDQLRAISPNASSVAGAGQFFEQQVAKVDDAISKRMDSIAAQVKQATSHLPPGSAAYKAERSREFSKLLDAEIDAMNVKEAEAWAKVPRSVAADAGKTKQFWEQLKEGTSASRKNANKAALPKWVDDTIGGWDKYIPVQELTDMRSEVLSNIRELKRTGGEGSAAAIRTLGELQGHLLERINGVDDLAGIFKGDDLKAFQEARAITTQKHARFESGAVGRMLRYEGNPLKAVDEDVMLESLVQNGVGGGVNVRAIFEAVPPEKAKQLLDDYVRSKFSEMVTDDGMLNVAAAKRFMSAKSWESTLNELPETKQYLDDIIRVAEKSDKGIRIAEKRSKNISEVQRARLFLERDPQIAFNRALYDPKNPSAAISRLVTEAGADKSGIAMAGLKRAGIDEMITSALNAAQTSPKGMEKWMATNRKALTALYSPEELKNIDRIFGTAKKVMNSFKDAKLGSSTMENSIGAQLISNLFAAAGSRLSPFKTLVAQTATAKIGRALARSLSADQQAQVVKDALLDPALGKELLETPTGWNQMKRLRGHLYNMGVDIDKAMEEEEKQAPPQSSVTTSGLNFV